MSIMEMKAIVGYVSLSFELVYMTDSIAPSGLIANFEFSLAYEGQLPAPTAAITMSTSVSPHCKTERTYIFYLKNRKTVCRLGLRGSDK
jgi:hypothetical protein